MTLEMMQAKMELKELADVFSNLADVKDAAGQGELFLPDGTLEFQMDFDGEINSIVGRDALVQAFAATINPCKGVYHINGQQNVTLNDDCTEAEGTAYCEASVFPTGSTNDAFAQYFVGQSYLNMLSTEQVFICR